MEMRGLFNVVEWSRAPLPADGHDYRHRVVPHVADYHNRDSHDQVHVPAEPLDHNAAHS
jgi:hypothetical protein